MAVAGERYKGWVRSFRGTWGFLNTEAFPGDLFVGLKGNPHLTVLAQGDPVEFEVKTDEKGKAEAVSVIPLSQKTAPSNNVVGAKPAAAQEPPGVTRYKGWVRSFTGSWGFVNSDVFEGDLFVGLRSNPHISKLAPGDQVEFEIKLNGSGKNEAVNVQLQHQLVQQLQHLAMPTVKPSNSSGPGMATTAALPTPSPATKAAAERAQVGHLLGHQVTGRIKSFRDQWGFVNSDTFVGDLFIHARSNPDLGPVNPGDPVQFEIAEDPTSSSGEFHAMGAIIMKDDVHNLIGETLRGWVKSFRDNWGLLNSTRFDGDIFVGVRANPHLSLSGLQQGECVEFQIARDEKSANGIQATKVKQLMEAFHQPLPAVQALPVTLPRTEGSHSGSPKPGAEAFVGLRARGMVRSFRDGWGFVVSDDFDGDLFLHQGSNPGLTGLAAGDMVTFDISLGSSGKCHATKVQAVSSELKDLVGRQCSGRVRSFHDTWGFVTSQKYSGDLFVGMRSNPSLTAPLKQGDLIEFMVQRSVTNKSHSGYEAVSVKVVSSSPVAGTTKPAGAPALPVVAPSSIMRIASDARSRSPRHLALATAGPVRPAPVARGPRDPASMVGSVLTGWIRSFRETWGFANSASFDGDLFIGTRSNSHLPKDPVVGDQIQFRVGQGAGGKLEAVDVQFT